MLKDVDLLAGIVAMAFAIAQVILAQQGVPLLEGTGFDLGAGAAGSFSLAALGRWYARWRKRQKRERAEE